MKTEVKYFFEGSVVVITGAASGIGLATARGFVEAGASVTIADNREEPLMKVAGEFNRQGYSVLAVKCDVTNDAEVKNMIDQTVAEYGRLDIAFNNAGTVGGYVPADVLSDEEWDRIVSVNLDGTWKCIRQELKQMVAQGSGCIINTSSLGGIVGAPGHAPYIASKHAIVGLTRSVALDYATRGIRVNAVCPGSVDTPMVDFLAGDNKEVLEAYVKSAPMERLGTAEEIAGAVLWLASSGATFVTGHALVVDGGHTIR